MKYSEVKAYLRTSSLILLLGTSSYGQATQSTILGSVRDSNGAAVPGSVVEIINNGTHFSRKVTTDEQGDYRVSNLEPGRYSVSVTATGFRRWLQSEVTLDSNQIRRVDAEMAVGEIANTVTITAEGSALATETATLANVKSGREFTQLPLSIFGRGWANITNVTAAVQSANGQFVVNGARDTANNFTSDGVVVNDIVSSRNMPNGFQMEVESFREVKVQTTNNSAEFAQVAQFIGISKAGENNFHGSLYWGNFNSIFSARSFFDSGDPAFVNHNMFATTIGGPVRFPKKLFGPLAYDGQDKTFFFFSYGGARYRTGNRSYVSVPTTAFRNGDFSAIAAKVTIVDPETGSPFLNNKIPAGRISPVAKAFQDLLYPEPNNPAVGDFGVGNNYTADSGSQFNSDVYNMRIDQKLSDKNTMFVRVGITKSNQDIVIGALNRGLDGSFLGNVPGRTVVLADTHTFNSKLVNEFRLGYNFLQYANSNTPLGADIVGTLGLQGISNPKNEDILRAMPSFGFSRFQGSDGTNLNNQRMHTYQLNDNLTWQTGRHTIKIGADVRWNQVNDVSRPSNERGSFSFDDQLSGFDYANFLLGLPSVVSAAIPRPGFYARSTQWAGYFQNDMNLGRKLTLNYGVRYEYQTPWVDKFDRRFAFDQQTGSLIVAGSSIPSDLVPELKASLKIISAKQAGLPERSLVYPDRNNWNPRIGLAYRPFANNRTVVRLGYGMYTAMFAGLLAFRGAGGPWQTNYTYSLLNNKPTMRFPNPFTGDLGFGGVNNISVVNPNLPAERAQQWNLSVGREIWGTVIDVAYVGTKTVDIPYSKDLNLLQPSTIPYSPARRPYSAFNNALLLETGGQAIFHGLTIQADRKVARGLFFNINYAFGKALTDVELRGSDPGFQQNQYRRFLERGPDTNIRKHQLRFSYIYELPIGRNRLLLPHLNRVGNAILSGWQLNGITTMISGQYLNPTYSGVDAANTNQTSGRPDRIGDGNIGDIRERIKAGLPMWDVTAFIRPQAGRGYYGNSGRWVLVGPGSQLWNAGLSKNFYLADGKARFQFRWELFNAFNHANFASGSTDITAGDFGRTSSGGAARSMLFGARIDF
jgi:carboxypeptidase family protein/TonB-dependent receptor-like protein